MQKKKESPKTASPTQVSGKQRELDRIDIGVIEAIVQHLHTSITIEYGGPALKALKALKVKRERTFQTLISVLLAVVARRRVPMENPKRCPGSAGAFWQNGTFFRSFLDLWWVGLRGGSGAATATATASFPAGTARLLHLLGLAGGSHQVLLCHSVSPLFSTCSPGYPATGSLPYACCSSNYKRI